MPWFGSLLDFRQHKNYISVDIRTPFNFGNIYFGFQLQQILISTKLCTLHCLASLMNKKRKSCLKVLALEWMSAAGVRVWLYIQTNFVLHRTSHDEYIFGTCVPKQNELLYSLTVCNFLYEWWCFIFFFFCSKQALAINVWQLYLDKLHYDQKLEWWAHFWKAMHCHKFRIIRPRYNLVSD